MEGVKSIKAFENQCDNCLSAMICIQTKSFGHLCEDYKPSIEEAAAREKVLQTNHNCVTCKGLDIKVCHYSEGNENINSCPHTQFGFVGSY